jgi:hypothetical protein
MLSTIGIIALVGMVIVFNHLMGRVKVMAYNKLRVVMNWVF